MFYIIILFLTLTSEVFCQGDHMFIETELRQIQCVLPPGGLFNQSFSQNESNASGNFSHHYPNNDSLAFENPPNGTETIDIPFGVTLNFYCTKCNYTKEECNCQFLYLICNITGINAKVPTEFTCKKEEIRLTKAISNVVFGVLGVLGNLLVIYVTYIYRESSTRCQFLIAGLAVVDFIFAIAQIILNVPELWTCHWLYGRAMCTLLHSSTDLSFMIALGFILLIGFERFVGILFPLSNFLTKRLILILSAVNVVLGIAVVLPSTIHTTTQVDINGNVSCKEDFGKKASKIYTIFIFVFYFLIPIIFASVIYFMIIHKLYTSYASTLTFLTTEQRERRVKDNKRIVKILVSILVAFVVLVLPNRIAWIVFDFTETSDKEHSIWSVVGFIPYSIHVAINPILYSLIDARFQKKLLNLFSTRPRRSSSSYDLSTSSSQITTIDKGKYRQSNKNSVKMKQYVTH